MATTTSVEAQGLAETMLGYFRAWIPDLTGIAIVVTTEEFGHVSNWPEGKEGLQGILDELRENTGVGTKVFTKDNGNRFMAFTLEELHAIHDGLEQERTLDPDEDPSFPPRIATAETLLDELDAAV